MKFLYDYFPIICFFIAFKFFGIYTATAVTIAASAIQVIANRLIHHRFEPIHVITFILILVLGGSTLIFHEDIFIKWKPSIVYWIFSITLIGSQFIYHQPLLQRMLGNKLNLASSIWLKLNIAWAIFFFLLGFLNLYVVYHYTTNTWVYFKLFGTLGLTIIFIIGQAIYMVRHMPADPDLLDKK